MKQTDMDIRNTLLTVIEEQSSKGRADATFQTNSILGEASKRLNARNNHEIEEAILTQWHDLFRTGYLAWGYNLANPNPPFFHLTSQGKNALAIVGRDPANPEGYLRYLYSASQLNPISKSYLEEGLNCYVSALYKSAAVMVGAASEALINELRDTVKSRLEMSDQKIPRNLSTWRAKETLLGLKAVFEDKGRNMPYSLKEEYESYWSAFTQQIRVARNDAGHPQSIEPIKQETVHASLLIFPELAKLSNNLLKWANENV
ncbi:MAG: hypothetical protein ACNY01_02105 [Desulfobacteria bacterium]